MQQPHQTVLPSSSLLQIFDHFFSETLSKDSNYHKLLKEWQNFKTLLSPESLDMDKIFAYVAKLQLNLSNFFILPALSFQVKLSQ